MANTAVQSEDALSMEAIAFQDKKYGLELENVFEEMLSKKFSGKEIDKQFSPRLASITKKFTNLTIVPQFNTGFIENIFVGGPSINAVSLSLNHIFAQDKKRLTLSENSEGVSRSIVEYVKEHKLKNTVDTRKAWVTGIFAEIPMRIGFPTSIVYKNKLTPAELSAVFLHEVGHAFTICELSNRLSTTNQVLAAMIRAKTKDTLEVQEFVFKAAGELLSNDEKMFQVTEDVNSVEAVFTVIMNRVEDYTHSESSTSHYDIVSCEQVADQFVNRMGYGRALVIALDKSFKDPNDKSNVTRHAEELLNTVFPILKEGHALIYAAFIGPKALLIAGIYTLVLLTIMTRKKGELQRDHTYDSSRVRYLRVREDLLGRIKDKKIPAEEVKEYLNDIRVIDIAVDSLLKTENKSYLELMANFIFKKHKQALDARMLQRQLEELASNDLYRVAAQLRTN